MSLASSLIISLSGLSTTSTQLELASNNIANANVQGYTRKTAIVSTAALGSVGGGTQVDGFLRASDNALYTTLTVATSNASLRSTQDDYLQQVQNILGTASSNDPTLSSAMTDFTTAWSQLAASPESLVAKRQVVQDANTLTEEVQRLASAVENLDRQCRADVESTISDLNSYLVQIKDLNQKIAQAVNANQSAGDLQDKRDQLVLKVSEITGVTVLQRNFGQIALYTSTGYQLVDGTSAREFTYDGADVTSTNNLDLSLNTALSGGKLQALINFRATTTPVSTDPSANVIQKLRDQLDMVVDMFTSQITTATSGEATFAAAYDSPTDATFAAASITGGLTFTAATAGVNGNNITVTLEDDPVNVGNYMATITYGATTEVYDNLSDGAVPGVHDVWTSLQTAIAGPPASALVTVAIDGLGNADPALLVPIVPPIQLAGGTNDSVTTQAGELAAGFFTGTDRTTFAVNATLLAGTVTVKAAAADEVSDALLDATRAFSADGIAVTSTSYLTATTSSLTSFQQAANNIATLKTTASDQRSYLEEKLTNQTNVNIDTEMVNLVTLQNTYAASAHCMSVVKDLFQVLENLL